MTRTRCAKTLRLVEWRCVATPEEQVEARRQVAADLLQIAQRLQRQTDPDFEGGTCEPYAVVSLGGSPIAHHLAQSDKNVPSQVMAHK